MKINSPEAIAINNEFRKQRGLPPWGQPGALVPLRVEDSRGIRIDDMLVINKCRYHVREIEGNTVFCTYLGHDEP